MIRIACALVVLSGLLCAIGRAQGTEPDVRALVDLIERGQGAEVKRDLPALLARSPNNPGILYVQGLLSEEGTARMARIVVRFIIEDNVGNSLASVFYVWIRV